MAKLGRKKTQPFASGLTKLYPSKATGRTKIHTGHAYRNNQLPSATSGHIEFNRRKISEE